MGPCTQQWNFLYVTEAAELLVNFVLGKHRPACIMWRGKIPAAAGLYRRAAPALRQSGKLSFGDRPPNAEGMVSLMPELTKLKAAVGFTQQIPFRRGSAGWYRRKGEI